MGRLSSFTQASGSLFFYFEYDYLPLLVSASWLQYVLPLLQAIDFLVEHVAAWLKTAFLILPSPFFVNHGTDHTCPQAMWVKNIALRDANFISPTREQDQVHWLKQSSWGIVQAISLFLQNSGRQAIDCWGIPEEGRKWVLPEEEQVCGLQIVALNCYKLLLTGNSQGLISAPASLAARCSQRLRSGSWGMNGTLWAIPWKGRNVSSLVPFSFWLAGISVSVVEQQLGWGDGCYLLRTAELCIWRSLGALIALQRRNATQAQVSK